MPKTLTQLLALYMPVLHRGYMDLFESFADIKQAAVFSNDLLQRVDYLRKDLRALSPEQQVAALKGLGRFDDVRLLSASDLTALNRHNTKLVMPDEDISREIAKSLDKAAVEFYPIFLRWDRQSVEEATAQPGETISSEQFDQTVMFKAYAASQQSSDIWRHVGAVLIDNNGQEINHSANLGEPSEHTPWIEGDPRNIFSKGVAVEISLFTHAEAGLIAEAARDGQALNGASIYMTTFPCPPCAKLIAHSGIKTCYYASGYAVLDGRRVLEDYGVKLVRVEGVEAPRDDRRLVNYKPS